MLQRCELGVAVYSLLLIDPGGEHVRIGERPDVQVPGGDLPAPEETASLAARPSMGVFLDLTIDAGPAPRELPDPG